ncbi:MAG: hypothetical protein LBJ95_03025 [Oscillospiraceae bacterium]|nr:hypothetical protein [Oscillospiraceae bacterium]
MASLSAYIRAGLVQAAIALAYHSGMLISWRKIGAISFGVLLGEILK